MDQTQLFAAIREADPDEGDVLYVERRGDVYGMQLIHQGESVIPGTGAEGFPDVWVYWSGGWPGGDTVREQAFFDDLLAEMESMAGGADRCRWSVDDPWPSQH